MLTVWALASSGWVVTDSLAQDPISLLPEVKIDVSSPFFFWNRAKDEGQKMNLLSRSNASIYSTLSSSVRAFILHILHFLLTLNPT
jgi:hypothetical protein